MRGPTLSRFVRRLARRALTVGLIALLLGLGFYLVLWWRLSAAIDRGLATIAPLAEVRRGTTFVGPDGRFGVESLEIVPRIEGLRLAPLRTGAVTVASPGLWWIAGYALRGEAALPDLLTFEIDRPGYAGEPAPNSQPMPLGLSTASPFESFGCGDPGFSLADIAGIGIRGAAPRATLTLKRETDARLAATLSAGSDKLGKTIATIYVALPQGVKPLANPAAASLISARIDVSDDGFVRARNRYCASRAGISQFEFITRHLAAVKSWLQGFDLVPATSVEASYRRFATRGRELSIEFRPPKPMSFAALAALPARERWEALAATIKTTGEPASELTWQFALPLPDPLEVGPPEHLAGGLVGAPAPASAGAASSAPPPPVAPAAARAEPPLPPLAAVDPGRIAPVPPPSVAPPAAPIPSPPAAPRESAGADAAARPSAEPRGVPAPITAPPVPATPPLLVFDDLASRVGQIVVVRSIYGTTRVGVLLRFTRAGISLRLSASDGGFELSMPARTIRTVSVGEVTVRGPGYR